MYKNTCNCELIKYAITIPFGTSKRFLSGKRQKEINTSKFSNRKERDIWLTSTSSIFIPNTYNTVAVNYQFNLILSEISAHTKTQFPKNHPNNEEKEHIFQSQIHSHSPPRRHRKKATADRGVAMATTKDGRTETRGIVASGESEL